MLCQEMQRACCYLFFTDMCMWSVLASAEGLTEADWPNAEWLGPNTTCEICLQDSQLDKDQSKYWSERDGGNYGLSTKQWQAKNYKQRKELEEKRVALFEAALGKFKKGDIEGVSSFPVCRQLSTRVQETD